MEHIAAILLIVGCSSDLTQCRELPAPTPLFETAEACAQTRPFAVDELAGRKPRVFGTCVAVDPALEEEPAEIVWAVTPDGRLDASVEPMAPETDPGVAVASLEPRPEKDYLGRN
jgi:hypothetical protein